MSLLYPTIRCRLKPAITRRIATFFDTVSFVAGLGGGHRRSYIHRANGGLDGPSDTEEENSEEGVKECIPGMWTYDILEIG